LGVLPFPFYQIVNVMKAGRITSIISESVNNKISYRESHPGFEDYHHCLAMDSNEAKTVFPTVTARTECFLVLSIRLTTNS
jgi:hypothetical protein